LARPPAPGGPRMMSRRALLWLSGAGAAALAAGLWLPTPTALREAPEPGGLLFPGLAQRLDRVASVEFRRGEAKLALRRQGEVWVLPAMADYPARSDRVRETLTGLTELRLVEARTADPALYDRLGVEDPTQPGTTAVLLRLLDSQGSAIAEVILGRRRMRTQGGLPEAVFIRRPNEAQSWLAEGRVLSDTDANLWVDRDIANLPASTLRQVLVQRAGEPELTLGAKDGQLAPIPPVAAALDPVALDEIARAFEVLTFTEVKPASRPTGEALGSARFEFADDLAITARLSRDGSGLWLRLAATGGAAAQRLDARWQGWAYQVGDWKEKAMLPRLGELEAKPAAPPAGAPPAR